MALSWVALCAALAALVACCAARPDANSVFLQERTRKSSSALRRSAGAVEDVAPEEVAALKQQIANLQAEKKGLVLAVRRLLKANRTEAEKSMVNALRGAKLQAQEAEKKLSDTQIADRMRIAQLLKIQKEKDSVEDVKRKALEVKRHDAAIEKRLQVELEKSSADVHTQASIITTLQSQVAKEEADLAIARKNARKQQDAEVVRLKEQNSKLQEENRGLEGTVQKLWKVNAPEGAKTMLKVLGDQDKRLQGSEKARLAEQQKFAQEKGELSKKLSDVERRYETDVDLMKTLQGDNQRLRASLQTQSSVEVGAKVASGLEEKNRQLESELAKQKLKESDDLHAAQSSVASALEGKNRQLESELAKQKLNQSDDLHAAQSSLMKLQTIAEKDEAENVKLLKAKQELESANQEQKKAFEKLQAAKDFAENIFAVQLSAIQKDLSSAKALVREKDEEIKNVSSREMKFYWNEWQHEQATLLNNITSGDKAKMILEAKVVDLSRQLSKQDEDASLLHNETIELQNQLKGMEAKFTYAVDQENVEMLNIDKLKADNSFLAEALRKEKELEPQLAKLQKHDEALRAANLKLANNVLKGRAKLKELEQHSGNATQEVAQEEAKLDFAVDQENTEMLAVKVLQGENQRLKESLQQKADLEDEMKRLKDDEAAKVDTIKVLEAEKAASNANLTALMERLTTVKRTNALLEDQYIRERSKLEAMAEQESTDALALKVLQGEYRKLEKQLDEAHDEEATMEQMAKAKGEASDAASMEADKMRRELEGLRQKEEELQHKNGELQETIAGMAAKSWNDHARETVASIAEQTYHLAAQPSPRPVAPVQQSDISLEKASVELSKLSAQLGKNNEKQTHTSPIEASAWSLVSSIDS